MLSRDQWLRCGWPRAALVLLVVVPSIVAGPIRVVTGLGLGAALATGTLLTMLAVAAFLPALRQSGLPARREIALTVALAAVALFAAALPYNRHFHGLADYIAVDGWYKGVDGGYHVGYYFDFTRARSVYHDFVSLYSFWDLFHRLGSRHLLVAINASFMFTRVVVALVPCVVAFSVLHKFREERRAYWAGVTACLVACAGVQYAIVLPQETFHAMGGFWSHLFGLVVPMAMWLGDALIRQRALRILALFAGCVLYRYTYGLNLADAFVAVGVILLIDAGGRALPAWARALCGVAALVAFLAARYCFHLVAPLFQVWGWIVDHDVAATRSGLLVALVPFAATICFPAARAAGAKSGIARALRFPLLFGLANVLIIHFIHEGTFYYRDKYDLHAVVLVASGAIVVASFWTAVCVRRFELATVAGALVLLALLSVGLVRVRSAFGPYQQGFYEQLRGGNYHRSQPLVIPAAVERIQRTLDLEGKAFGGYLSKQNPMYIFTNAIFDHGELHWLSQRTLTDKPGTCVFWDGGKYPEWDELEAKRCFNYVQQPWGTFDVCSACF
jgi:hypothetical protein